MSDRISSALSAEEWQQWKFGDDGRRECARLDWCVEHRDGEIGLDAGYSGRNRHAVAALCLYQQPFGFSPEDVAAIDALLGCRIATSDLGPEEIIDGSVSSDEFAAVESVLRKIKALLPPEPKA